MVNEDKPKKRYVPVAVTARKVGEIEGSDGKEDILKIDMPVRDDREDNVNKEKEENDMGELNEAQVDKRVSEILGKMKLQETIDKIREKNEEIDSKVSGISEKVTGVNEKLGENSERLDDLKSRQEEIKNKQEEIRSKQEEACTGVDCLKKDLGKIDELRGDVGRIKDIDEKLGKLNETVGADYSKCSGPKGCNEDIKVGSSFCPNCGARISEWEGHPEWAPYWKRQK